MERINHRSNQGYVPIAYIAIAALLLVARIVTSF
jgi:hypothetical protein